MIPGVVAFRRQSAGPALQHLVFPLSYDELDAAHAVSLTRAGGAGPHVTPEGFEGDGYGARYTTTALPSYAGAGKLSLQASIRKPRFRLRSARDVDVFLGTNDAAATPRLSFETVSDSKGDSAVPFGTLALRGHAGTVQEAPLCRVGWRFEWRTPELSRGGYAALPQAVLFIDASTVLFLVHLENTEDVVYRVDLASGAVTGFFSFGAPLVAGTHLAGMARRSNGDVWFSGYSSTMLRVDLAASLAAGTAQILQTVTTEMTSVGAGCFMEVGGVEYHIAASYNDSADASVLALFPASVLVAGLSSLALSSATKTFELGRRIQGLVGRSGQLLVARNRPYGGSTSATTVGLIETYNIAGMLSSLATGSAVHAGANASYLLASNVAPSTLPEQMAVHPVSNRLYVPTEGYLAVGDVAGWSGLWSTDFGDAGELNHYTAEFDGVGAVAVKINGQPFTSLSWALSGAAVVLSIGGMPAASGGFTNGFSVAQIANVALVNQAVGGTLYGALVSGSFEAQSLNSYQLTLTNPGAEAGNTTGWTAEIGAMNVRSVNPAPYAGSFYFNGGSAVQSLSRQRLDLVAQGVPSAKLDPGTAWAKIRWKQAAWNNNDPGGMGVRTLTSADATIATSYAALAFTPFGPGAAPGGPWFPRCWPVLLAGTTRKVDALYNASGRTEGTNNDHYVDEVSVTVYAPQL
ncbi:hypothetical protein LLE81_00275 [Staphylococcus epidermidis]|nr:hypothetical protein [Staphylococcus epidermidis]